MYCPNEDCPDAKQTGSPGEYRDEVVRCPMCGSDLVPRLPRWAEREEEEPPAPEETFLEHEALVPVREVGNRALIPLVHSILDAAGIRHHVRNEMILDRISSLTGAVVLVEPSRADEARALLSELDSGSR